MPGIPKPSYPVDRGLFMNATVRPVKFGEADIVTR